MKSVFVHIYVSVCVSMLLAFSWPGPASAEDSYLSKIRVMSAKKNERIFNKIAIDLLNGNSRFIPLDYMVKILDDYNIVEFHSREIEQAREIILKELAYRMLKQHYLPRVGDKIRIYKQQEDFSRATGFDLAESGNIEAAVMIPVEIATIKDRGKLNAIYWKDMVGEISAVVEKLWLKRIRQAGTGMAKACAEDEILLEAAILFRKGIVDGEGSEIRFGKDNGHASMIADAACRKLKQWLIHGHVSKPQAPFVAEMMVQFIILSDPVYTADISKDFQNLASIADLRNGLIKKVEAVSEILANNNPSDYAVIVMLQSLINMADNNSPSFDISPFGYPRNQNIQAQKSRHWA